MQKREIYERLQTEYSGDEYFYKYTQHEMDALDEQAEYIRGILEGRWEKWRGRNSLMTMYHELRLNPDMGIKYKPFVHAIMTNMPL